jgi:hypothetical protein
MNDTRTAGALFAGEPAGRLEPRRDRVARGLVATYVHEASGRHEQERETAEEHVLSD